MKMVKLYKGLLCLYIALCLVFTGGLTALSADAQVQNESAGLTDVVYDFTKGMTEGEDVMLLTEYDETGIKNINWKYKNKIQASYTIIFYQDTMRVNGSNIHADTSFEIKPPEHGKYRVKMSYSQAFTGTNQNGATSIDVWMAKFSYSRPRLLLLRQYIICLYQAFFGMNRKTQVKIINFGDLVQ
jgi:hypothetical protein